MGVGTESLGQPVKARTGLVAGSKWQCHTQVRATKQVGGMRQKAVDQPLKTRSRRREGRGEKISNAAMNLIGDDQWLPAGPLSPTQSENGVIPDITDSRVPG